MQNSQQFEVGDRVYCMLMGQHGTVVKLDADPKYPIQVRLDEYEPHRLYTLDGRYYLESKAPCLFFDKPQFEVPQKPFKATYKPGTILCIRSKYVESYRVLQVMRGYLIDGKEAIEAKCLASSYPEELDWDRIKFLLEGCHIQVIPEPSE